MKKIIENLESNINKNNALTEEISTCHNQLKSMELNSANIQSKLETLTTKESTYNNKKEEHNNELKKQQVLTKNAKEPFKKLNVQDLLKKLNETKNELKTYGKVNLRALDK